MPIGREHFVLDDINVGPLLRQPNGGGPRQPQAPTQDELIIGSMKEGGSIRVTVITQSTW
ncbi:MAG: hypothetical protein HW416_525 [Chloroflexi bacterium]|nr:hypothetical protein [Chloroflexota bacterium]